MNNDWSAAHHDSAVMMILSSSFPWQQSGYVIRSHGIVTHLLRKGVDLRVYTRPGYPLHAPARETEGEYQDIVDGVTYRRLPFYLPGEARFGAQRRDISASFLALTAQKTGVRIIHAASDGENGYPAMCAARKAGCLGVYEYRGMWHYTSASLNAWFPKTRPFRDRQELELATGHKADAVFAISEALKADLIANGLPEEKISVLPNAVDTSRFSPSAPDQEIRERYQLEGRCVIGFFGSLTNYEGLESLIDAVLELNSRGKPVSLLIVGGSDYYLERLRRWHEVRGGHPAIIITGQVPFTEVTRYYSVVDIMAFPRINAKVCQCVPPLKPMESMAMKKAVLVSDVAALKEMVQDGETGLLCRAGDLGSLVSQLERLVDSKELRERLAAAGLEWVQRERSWDVVSERILRVYERLLGDA